MGNVATIGASAALSVMDENRIIAVLKSSLYPGSADDSIRMVMAYCEAAGLDAMQKPVHLVPMWDSKSKSTRDVVMPGISLYRTMAARTGAYAGVSDPEFGPDKTENLGGVEVTYPEWCRVVVKRILNNGQIAEFAATERWKENYAQKGGQEKSVAPNAMWHKRPFGQIAKCAEAQALRKAFPEVGSQPTAEEMEGKQIERDITASVERVTAITELPQYPDEQMLKNLPAWTDAIQSGKRTHDQIIAMVSSKYRLSDEQLSEIAAIGNDVNNDNLEGKPW